METALLDYTLPRELIAQHPGDRRDASRMRVVDRRTGGRTVDVYRNVAQYLNPGDCMVLNDTRVIRARLHGFKDTGGRVEVFLLREEAPGQWLAMVRPSAKVRPGAVVRFSGGLSATAGEALPDGRRRVRFDRENVLGALCEAGEIPLPPYIHRESPEDADLTRYQTVYARRDGAVAAPTAGLHLTPEVFAALDARGVDRAFLTLHVGYGTFKPVTADTLEEHRVDPEEYDFPEETAARLNAVRAAKGRVVAVGTTSTRVLESRSEGGVFTPGQGMTSTYILPPHTFTGVDALQTNFHLPKSSLLALVCAFAGVELTLEAYRFAVAEKFRFYSYGDVMLIL